MSLNQSLISDFSESCIPRARTPLLPYKLFCVAFKELKKNLPIVTEYTERPNVGWPTGTYSSGIVDRRDIRNAISILQEARTKVDINWAPGTVPSLETKRLIGWQKRLHMKTVRSPKEASQHLWQV